MVYAEASVASPLTPLARPGHSGRMAQFVTSGDLARALGVTLKTLRRWERAGKVPAAQRGPVEGSHRRWPAEVAAQVVRAAGGTVPADWKGEARAA